MDQQQETSDQHHPPKQWTFRVRGVPLGWDVEQLESLLAEQDSTAGPTVQSLADELDSKSRTATVIFQNLPSQLQMPLSGRRWPISLPADSNRSTRPQSLTLDNDFLGITTLYAPPPEDHKVDIIAISGLGGHAFGSFTERDGEHMWLRDALPHDITGEDKKPLARVMVYGYESSLPQSKSVQNLEDLGTSFHSSLLALAPTATLRPIIFVAHSLGGLIVKQTLISLSKSKNEDNQKLIQAVYGIVFFGVPHGGMDIDTLIPMVGDGPNRFLLESINSINSQILSIQQREFLETLGGKGESEVICFYETRMSPTAIQVDGKWKMEGPEKVLVTKASATHCRPWEDQEEHICAVSRTHSGMVKFGLQDDEYDKALQRIKGLTIRALAAHAARTAKRSLLRPELSQESQGCLRSLAFPEMDNRSNDIRAAAEGTCEWLLRHDTYRSWVTCDRGLLWIKGKPGSGKSTLLRYALDNIMVASNIASNVGANPFVLSFFFHGRGIELQRTQLGLFQSLLHQLLSGNELPDLVATFRERCNNFGEAGVKWQWHLRELQHLFKLSLTKVLQNRSVWLFVDALDESGEASANELIEDFKSLVQTLPLTRFPFRICFSCRQYPILDLDCKFDICMEQENRDAIATYVKDRLFTFSSRKSSTIPTLIINRANGIFLWAFLMVKRVLEHERKGDNLATIKAEIRSIPPELNELYHELVRGMTSASLKLIQWICFATRPLLLDELRWAMVVDADCPHKSLKIVKSDTAYILNDEMELKLKTLSCGLAEGVPSSNKRVVQFIHQSVKDFFVEKGLSALHVLAENDRTDEVVGTAHYRLSRTCIRYLAMEEISQSTIHDREGLMSKFPLLHYATTSWVGHVKQSEERKVSQDDLLDYFAWPSENLLQSWVQVYRKIERYSENCPPNGTRMVHTVSRYHLLGPLQAILQKAVQANVNVDSKDNYGQTPLSWAARNGHEAVVQLLLGAKANVDVDSKDTMYGQTPLSWAARNGREAVVQLLLGAKANVDVDSKDTMYGRTPLSWAAENGREAVVQLLLRAKANVDSKDNGGRTPLSWAVGTGRTPLSWAARNGREAVVQLLLRAKANVDSKDNGGQTPLSWAARNGHEAVVQLLLRAKANVDVDSKDKYGQTPLSWAAGRGHEAVVQLLQIHASTVPTASALSQDGSTEWLIE